MTIIINLLPSLLSALKVTMTFALIVWFVSIPLAIPVAILRMSNNVFGTITRIYINLMRGTPLLLQLMFVYFGLPMIGITFQNRESAAYFAFIINYIAYFAEIYRGGIQSIDKGQMEAAKMLGMSRYNSFTKIILPQVFKRVLPSLGNEATTLIKDTSLIHILGISELMKVGRNAVNTTSSLLPFLAVGVIYFIVITLLDKIFEIIEKKLSYYE